MKVLHISKYYHPFMGGIEKVIMELAEGTVKQGHEVAVLCSNESWEYKEEIINGVKIIRLPRHSVAFSQPMTMSFFWKARKWMQWADVVQVHAPNPLAELGFLLQEQKKPLIVSYHCDVVRQKNLVKVYKPVAKKVLEKADRIVVSTPHHLNFSESLSFFKDKIDVIPFGVKAKHAKRTLEINNNLKKIKDQYGDYFLFVGRLVPYKGVDVLLRAMRDIKENLLIIGIGPRWDGWHMLAKDFGVQDKVHFLGAVTDDNEFAAYLHGCHSLVLPSINESEAFGIVLIEAMSCGRPVITTNLKSGVPWVNKANYSGLQVEPNNSQELSAALQIMAKDHDLRQQFGVNARLRFEEMFQVETMVQSYVSLYEKEISKGKVAA